MFNFIVCGVIKKDTPLLSEWLQHYLGRGVDHIYLVNDNSTDDFMSVIKPFADKVTLFQMEGPLVDTYFRPILEKAKWATILGLNEFLYSPSNETFVDILARHESVSQLQIDRFLYGSNEHIFQPISVVAAFPYRDVSSNGCSTLFKAQHPPELPQITVHEPALLINKYGKTLGTVYDLRLFEQNRNIVNNALTLGTSDEVTLVITSCNRPALLMRTLQSFVEQNTYPIKETFIIDDSGFVGCNEYILEPFLKSLNITAIYNPKNLGQIESIDKVYSYVRTKWIFHCEEDWAFLQPGFIEKSMSVFRENPEEKIYTVWLRPHHCTSRHPILYDSLNRGYYEMKRDFSYNLEITYTWGGFTFNPGLRRTADCLLLHPYSLTCEKMKRNGREYIGEYSVNKAYTERGFYAMILADPRGHVNHIGWDQHIPRFFD